MDDDAVIPSPLAGDTASLVMLDDSQKLSMFFTPNYSKMKPQTNPYHNENYEDRFHWKWDKNNNRLMQLPPKPKVSQYHHEIVNYIDKRRRKTQSMS